MCTASIAVTSRPRTGNEAGAMKPIVAAIVALLLSTGMGVVRLGADNPVKFDTKTADFAVTFHGETSAYTDTMMALMPRGTVIVDAVGGPPGDYTLTTTDGIAVQQGLRQWKWTA